MFTYIWPLLLIILSNILYQICAKEIPEEMNTYASMSVTYAVATIFSLLAFFVSSKGSNIFKAFSHTNWATVVLGLVAWIYPVLTALKASPVEAMQGGELPQPRTQSQDHARLQQRRKSFSDP